MIKKKKTVKKKTSSSYVFKGIMYSNRVVSNSSIAMQLYEKSMFGEPIEGKISYSFSEAFYLMQKRKLTIYLNGKKLSADKFVNEVNNIETHFMTRYSVFADLRNKGYVVKTGLRFGADFRVYDKGVKPGKGHSKWIVYPVSSGGSSTWQEFAAKNRVAHSTKKHLLIAIVDDEGDVTYYNVSWLRP